MAGAPARAQLEDEDQIPLPGPSVTSAEIAAPAPPVKKKPVPPGFCDTIDAKLAACLAADPKKIKKIAFSGVETAAVKQKRKDAKAKELKTRELCQVVKAQREKVAKLRAGESGNAGAAASNMERQANLIEKTAAALLDEALRLLKEIGECPSWQDPAAGKKPRSSK
ncbi:MAG: hypothetical protein A2X35_01520 [Elusimicrobia bacterium GWA2_61_42]|nr:MAG: hypothetical protein A2X35_01520 [Elusimicrobia bacterium GWA2_61_42]OGR76826.1 MAG: hypothetical protein A2X38_11695 [Elusimicrobia bacterium GWC2_61_25]